ncbi:Pollen receptor-like kinase 1, partial [Cucurbita argyrosperma subsp. argyrosperma]
MPKPCLFLFFFLLFNPPPPTSAATAAESLLRFRSSLTNATALSNWNSSVPLCADARRYWAGLICKNGQLYGLRLEHMGLGGTVDVAPLAELPTLRTLSLMNNGLQGPMPDVKQIGALRALYLSDNNFSGWISGEEFEGMGNLKKLYLGRNRFSGEIPASLVKLKGLVDLGLEGNLFAGRIPDFEERDWKYLNFSGNRLVGPIPSGFKNSNFTSFFGNNGLCGEPLAPCKSSTRKWSILIGVFSAAVAALILFILLLCCFLRPPKLFFSPKILFRRPEKTHQYSSTDSEDNSKMNGPTGSALCFLRTDQPRFDLQELLRAQAKVLGSGSFASCYKAVLSNGLAVVVKRFRQMNAAGKDEFYSHMRRLGRLSHPNLLPVVAFYYGKDDKLLLPNSSVPHGHLKSSNVLLDQDFTPILSDYALFPLLQESHAYHHMSAFKSPDFAAYHDRTSKSTDVWSLGILILEILTGKSPANYLHQGNGANADLADWVDTVVREEWTAEVFNNDLVGRGRGKEEEDGRWDCNGEMLKLLQIGMCCCERDIGKRWGLKQAVEKIELNLNEDEDDDEYYSSYGSFYSNSSNFKATVPEDEFSFLS